MRLPSFLTTIGAAAFLLIATPASAAKYPGALDVNGPTNVYPGQVAVYTVTATNISTQQLNATVTSFHFNPATMEFVPGQSTNGCFVTNNEYVDCILGDMQPGAKQTVQFAFRVKDNAQCNSQIDLDVDYKAAGGLLVDWSMFKVKVECKKKYKCYNRNINLIPWIFKKHHHSHKPYTELWDWKLNFFKKVAKTQVDPKWEHKVDHAFEILSNLHGSHSYGSSSSRSWGSSRYSRWGW